LSPLIGAFFLRRLDEQMSRLGLFYLRFMDDILVLAPTRWKLKAVAVVNRRLRPALEVRAALAAVGRGGAGRAGPLSSWHGQRASPPQATVHSCAYGSVWPQLTLRCARQAWASSAESFTDTGGLAPSLIVHSTSDPERTTS
jgi:hypothetical protein